MFKKLNKFCKLKEKGQTFVEYGVVIAVVACIAIAGFASAGNSINDKVTAMYGSTPTAEPTSAYWGVSTDNVLTLSTKKLSAAEGSVDNGEFELAGSGYVHNTWGKYLNKIVAANIKDAIAPSDTSSWFNGMNKLKTINNIQNLDTSNVTDMMSMFGSCTSLTSLDVTHFDTSNVTNMGEMFRNCYELTSLDVSHFDTSNVTDMDSMFVSCSSLTSLDVSHFNTSKVTDMSWMFKYCQSLTSLDTSKFVINSETDTYEMYNNCPATHS